MPAVFHVGEWRAQIPNTASLKLGETFARRQVLAIAEVDAGTLPDLSTWREGQRVRLPVRFGGFVTGVVNLKMPNDAGWVRIGGGLEDGVHGSFSISQRQGVGMNGTILRHDTGTGYVIETTARGTVRMIEKPLSAIQCVGMPMRIARPQLAMPGPQATVGGSGSTPASPMGPVVPVPDLDSLPTATHVLYLDFDGEIVTDPYWNDGFPIFAVPPTLGGRYLSSAQITDVWKRVSEDFAPYNISVTTILSRYTAAGAGKRMRCIITPTEIAMPGAGGVAAMDSYDRSGSWYSSTVPCWTFTSSYISPNDFAVTISHEIGHTLGLSHDGLFPASDGRHVEYYDGHGAWMPLMGGGYDFSVSQWSKGEYNNANNFEDDIAIIGNTANGFRFRTDEAGTTAPFVALPNTGIVNQSGIITASTDADHYALTVSAGTINLVATPALVSPNLDIVIELRAADGVTILKAANPAGLAKAALSYLAPAGKYVVAIYGTGSGTAATGYTSYGSVGAYTLTGTFAAVPDFAPNITQPPSSQTVPSGSKVTLTVTAFSNTAATYQWTKDNVAMLGQTKNVLLISSAQPASQGSYRCNVTNSIGTTISDPAVLTVNYKPVITQQPAARTTPAGTDTTFAVVATGVPAPTYQWQFNSVNIVGATSSSYTVVNPQWPNAGSYRCVITNTMGSVTSSAAALTVSTKPWIITQPPAAQLVPFNGSASLSITAAGTGTVGYQWFKGSTLITGATKSVLTLAAISAATAETYLCEVRNSLGITVSNNCVVTVQAAPVITRDLGDLTLARNAKATLSLGVVGSPTLLYEWRKDGVKVGTTPSLIITALADANYQCIVTNSFGYATSAIAHLSVHDVPAILTQPLSQTKALGGSVDFTVVLKPTSTPPFTYVWRKNNAVIPGNAATLTLSGLAAIDAASYTCTVSNDVGSVTTAAAKLTLQTAPTVTVQPVDMTVFALAAATFSATATGTATLRYQWQKAPVASPMAFSDIPGATAATFKIASTTTGDDAIYRLRVTNTVGLAYSNPVRLTVTPITTPTLTVFHPTQGKAGYLIRLNGSGLHWTTGLTMLKTPTVPIAVPFIIVSNTELLATIPVGAITSPFIVTTRGGTATSSATLTISSSGNTNDNFAQARILPGAGGSATGDTTGFTLEPSEPYHANVQGGASAWFEWTPTVSGSYWLSTATSKFDTLLAIYTGTSVSGLTAVGYNDGATESYYNGSTWEDKILPTSKLYQVVTAGVTYHIAIDRRYDSTAGAYTLTITRIASMPN